MDISHEVSLKRCAFGSPTSKNYTLHGRTAAVAVHFIDCQSQSCKMRMCYRKLLCLLSQTGLAVVKLCELLLAHCPLSDNVTEGIVLLTVMHVGLLWSCFLSALYSMDISGCRKTSDMRRNSTIDTGSLDTQMEKNIAKKSHVLLAR